MRLRTGARSTLRSTAEGGPSRSPPSASRRGLRRVVRQNAGRARATRALSKSHRIVPAKPHAKPELRGELRSVATGGGWTTTFKDFRDAPARARGHQPRKCVHFASNQLHLPECICRLIQKIPSRSKKKYKRCIWKCFHKETRCLFRQPWSGSKIVLPGGTRNIRPAMRGITTSNTPCRERSAWRGCCTGAI